MKCMGYFSVFAVLLVAQNILAEDVNENSSAEPSVLARMRSGIRYVVGGIGETVAPALQQRKERVGQILSEHKNELKKRIGDMKDVVKENLLNTGADLFEKGLELGDAVQSLTQHIKQDVLMLANTEKQ